MVRVTTPIGISFSGDSGRARGLVPLARTVLGQFTELLGNKEGNFSRTFSDGTIISISLVPGLPEKVNIFCPIRDVPEIEDFLSGFTCTPSVHYTGAKDGWGEPFKDSNGELINPPFGTVGGAKPEVIIRHLTKTSINFSVLHSPRYNSKIKKLQAGNIDWVLKRGDSIRYLTWQGPWGRSIAPRIVNNLNAYPIINEFGYTRQQTDFNDPLPLFSGNQSFWLVRWTNEIYLDGILFVKCPTGRVVTGTAITSFQNNLGQKEEYIVCTTTKEEDSFNDDQVHSVRIEDIDPDKNIVPSWNNMGTIVFTGMNVYPRITPILFDSTGKNAIHTFLTNGFLQPLNLETFEYATLRITLVDKDSFTFTITRSGFSERTDITSDIRTCVPDLQTTKLDSTTEGPIIISSDYNPLTDSEIFLTEKEITFTNNIETDATDHPNNPLVRTFSEVVRDTNRVEFILPDSTKITIDGAVTSQNIDEIFSGITAVSYSQTFNTDEARFDPLSLDLRYNTLYYLIHEVNQTQSFTGTTFNAGSDTWDFDLVQTDADKNTLFKNNQILTSKGDSSFSSSSGTGLAGDLSDTRDFCFTVGGKNTGSTVVNDKPIFFFLQHGQIFPPNPLDSKYIPDNFMPDFFTMINEQGETMFSFWLPVTLDNLTETFILSFDSLTNATSLSNTTKINEQVLYNINDWPRHKDVGIF